MVKFLLIALVSLSSVVFADTAPDAVLAATMTSISADVDVITVLAKSKTPATLKDSVVAGGIAHARTAGFQIQLISDRRSDEMIPPVVAAITDEATKKKMLDDYATALAGVKSDFDLLDTQISAELAKSAAERSFVAVGQTLQDIATKEQAAHKVFNPKP